MNRKKKFILNSISGLFKQIVVLICGFVMTKFILMYYGSSVNGLVASITQFLGFISFLEMGIGPVIQSNLYKPLAVGNNIEVSKIVKSSEKFFRHIAYIFMGYIVILLVVFPIFIKSGYSFIYTSSLLIIISISSLTQYYFGMTYQLLLNADQKGYIQVTLQWITLLISTILCIILMEKGVSIQGVRLVTAIVYLLRPMLLCKYVKKHYMIDKKVEYAVDPIKQKWNGFAQHISAVVLDNTDVLILSIMSSLKNISIYTVYYSVVYGITQVVMVTVNGLEAMWGNMIANDEWDNLKKSFSFMEWLIHTIVTIIFVTAAILITPFVKVYTMGITDADYNQPLFGILLVAAFAIRCFRVPYFCLTKAVGHYKETQNGAFIAMALNIIISVVFVHGYGLIGVAIGTLIALLFHTLYFVIYLSKNVMRREIMHFSKNLLIDIVTAILAFIIVNIYIGNASSYFSWIIMAIKATISVLLISGTINMIFYKTYFLRVINEFRVKMGGLFRRVIIMVNKKNKRLKK